MELIYKIPINTTSYTIHSIPIGPPTTYSKPSEDGFVFAPPARTSWVLLIAVTLTVTMPGGCRVHGPMLLRRDLAESYTRTAVRWVLHQRWVISTLPQ